MGEITCRVPSDQCPWDNCDTCEAGKEYIMELEKIIEIKKTNYEEAKETYEHVLKEYGEENEYTKATFLIASALHRDVPEELKPGRECPGCRRQILINSNFCSACGKAILY